MQLKTYRPYHFTVREASIFLEHFGYRSLSPFDPILAPDDPCKVARQAAQPLGIPGRVHPPAQHPFLHFHTPTNQPSHPSTFPLRPSFTSPYRSWAGCPPKRSAAHSKIAKTPRSASWAIALSAKVISAANTACWKITGVKG